jgi:hypothetical protein
MTLPGVHVARVVVTWLQHMLVRFTLAVTFLHLLQAAAQEALALLPTHDGSLLLPWHQIMLAIAECLLDACLPVADVAMPYATQP